MQGTIQIVITTTPDLIDELSDELMALGALAISLTDAKDNPVFQTAPEETPLWEETTIKALFPEDTLIDPLVDELKKTNPKFANLSPTIEAVANKNWVEETQKQFPPQQFGTLWVCPEWEKAALQKKPSDPVIYIAPGLAFGTGTHPTTKLCLEWLSNNPPKNLSVVDYGCGSGILALAALILGADTVYATDHDPQALESTQHNAACNDFQHSTLHIKETNEMSGIQSDLVLANILANPLIELAPTLIALLKPDATLILSGLLEADIERVTKAYQQHCAVVDTLTHDGWALVRLKRCH